MKLNKALALATSFAGVQAFWRMECQGRLGVARIDPLVNPGAPSLHAHSLHGSSGLTESSGYHELRAGSCSSCRVTEDKSAYWTPSLYFQDAATGEYELVEQVGGMLAYYSQRNTNVTAFPPGFSMIAGDSNRRDYTAGNMYEPDPDQSHWAELGEVTQDRLRQRAIGFNCLNFARGQNEATLYRHYMPDKDYITTNCISGLRAEIAFPACWNGEASSANHKDHVAYMSLVLNGDCPDSHPYQLPLLMYETIWAVAGYANRNGAFVWSNGDSTGLGYHGDFIAGWDTDYLQAAIDTCTNLSGEIEDCEVFANNLVSEYEARKCTLESLPSSLTHENTTGPMKELPGAPAGSDENSDYSSHSTELGYAPGTAASSGYGLPEDGIYGGHGATTSVATAPTASLSLSILPSPSLGDIGHPGVIAAPPAVDTGFTPPIAAVTQTTALTTATPTNDHGSIFSTQWVTRSGVVQEIVWELDIVSVTKTQDFTTTVTTTVTPTPEAHKVRRANGHRHRMHRHA